MTDPERKRSIERLLLSEPVAARVTGGLMEEMLEGFGLPQRKDCDWFAEQIRPLVWVVARKQLPKGNAAKRDEAVALAQRLRELWADLRIFAREAHYDEIELIRELERNPEGFHEKQLISAYYNDERLVWRAKFLELLASRLDEQKQAPKWRAKAKRHLRVGIALQLMPIFEEGFGRKATLDKWPSTTGDKSLGHWADFYQRFMAATLGEKATPDLEGVLTEARRQLGASGYSPGDFITE